MTNPLQSLIGVTQQLGSHHFTADEITRFARKYDPQPFHTDPVAARDSHFGALCASGWHTAAAWMALNVAARLDDAELGPSPGFRDLKWLRPVYAGDTISYTRTVTSLRPSSSRPDWSVLAVLAEGTNQNGDKVFESNCAALVKLKSG